MAKVKHIPRAASDKTPLTTNSFYHEPESTLFPRGDHPDTRSESEWRQAVEAKLQTISKKTALLNQFRRAFDDKTAYYSLRN